MDIRLVADNTCQCGRTIISRASHAVCPFCGHATTVNYSRSAGVPIVLNTHSYAPRTVSVPVVLNTQRRVVYTQPRVHRYIIADEY